MFADYPHSVKLLPEDNKKYKAFVISQFKLTPLKEVGCW